MRQLLRHECMVYLTAVVVSIVLSCLGSLRAEVINPDGICYLQSAATVGSAGLHAAMQLCGQAQWPFYSTLIYGLVLLTHVSYVTAAFVLNGFFSIISVTAFILLVQLLGGSRRVLWLAAAVILLANEFNSVREYVIRDHGFWAFYLLSMVCLLQYFRTQSWRYAVLWSTMMVVATLFRVEGVFFLLFIPLITWFDTGNTIKKRLLHFLQLNAVLIIIGACLITGLLFVQHPASYLSRLGEIQYQFLHGLSSLQLHFQAASTGLANHVLSPYSAGDANLILFLLLIVWYGVSVISNLSVIYTLLVIYAIWSGIRFLDKPGRQVVCSYIVVNVLITATFLVNYLFLSKRYLIALSLVLMLWVPFALSSLVERRNKPKWLLPIIVFFIIVNALSGIVDFGYSKTYIRSAGEWLAEHAPANAVIYSNDEQVMYYSNHFGNDIFLKFSLFSDPAAIAAEKWKQYDYIALRLNKNETEKNAKMTTINLVPTQIFSNKRGDRVVIYQVSR